MLKKHRLAAGLSQSQLAKLAGVTISNVNSHERGEANISAGRLYLFARALEVEPATFFEGLKTSETYAIRGNDDMFTQTMETVNLFYQIESADIRSRIARIIKLAASKTGKRRSHSA